MRAQLIASIVCVACAAPPAPDDAALPPDAGARADAGPLAAPPLPPRLTPCPSGWREIVAEGIAACDPFPPGGARTDCAADEAHFPGEPGCSRIGTACAADGWPADLPEGATIYVAPGGTGDGSSRAAPLATIGAALAIASSGTVVAVAVGTYDGAIAIPAGVTVWGACASGTRITDATTDELGGVVDATGPGAVIRNVTIGDAIRPGVFLEDAAASLRVEDAIVERVVTLGLAADHGRLEARSVLVRDVAARPSDGAFGRGLSAGFDGFVSVSRAVVERTHTTGVFARFAPARLVLSDAVVRDSLEVPSGIYGRGAAAQDGGRLELERVVIDRSRELGVFLSSSGTASLRDVVVRDTLGRDGDGGGGIGIHAESGATIDAVRVRIERSRTQGLIAAGGTITASDAIVIDTEVERLSGQLGLGATAYAGGSMSLTRALVARGTQVGVGAAGVGSSVSLTDVTIVGTRGRPDDGTLGIGLWAQRGATIEGRRLIVRASRTLGVGAVRGASIAIEDARIEDTASAACGEACPEIAGGIGAAAHYLGGRVRLTRFEIDGAALCGVVVGRDAADPDDPGGELDLADGVVARAPVGACVQVDGYDLERLRGGVLYRDVGVPLQATTYRLPSDVL